VLKEAGVDPAPARENRTTWKEFLRTHWDVLAAADFFSVEVWARRRLSYHFTYGSIPTRASHSFAPDD
jgi:putative transposase